MHDLATELGLSHASHGEGQDRRARVWRGEDGAVPTENAAVGETSSVQESGVGDVGTVGVGAPSASNGGDVTDSALPRVLHESPTLYGEVAAEQHGADEIEPRTSVLDKGCNVDGIDNVELTLPEHSEADACVGDDTTVGGVNAGAVPSGTSSGSHHVDPPPKSTRCSLCGHSVPDQNYDVHVVRCERQRRLDDKARRSNQATESISQSSASRAVGWQRGGKASAGSGGKGKHAADDALTSASLLEERDAALIESFTKDAKTCQHPECRRSVVLIGARCPHCAKTHCTTHTLPESHGCGVAAATEARRQRHQSTAKIHEGASADRRRQLLEKKFKATLSEKESARVGDKGKKTDDKKGKKKKK